MLWDIKTPEIWCSLFLLCSGVTAAVCSALHSHRDLCSKVCDSEIHADSDWCVWDGNSTRNIICSVIACISFCGTFTLFLLCWLFVGGICVGWYAGARHLLWYPWWLLCCCQATAIRSQVVAKVLRGPCYGILCGCYVVPRQLLMTSQVVAKKFHYVVLCDIICSSYIRIFSTFVFERTLYENLLCDQSHTHMRTIPVLALQLRKV